MIGVIPHLLFDFVEKNWGAEGLQELKARARMAADKTIRLDTYYPEEEWQRLFEAAVALTHLQPEYLEQAFGRYCVEDLVLRFPGFFEGAVCARDMIRRQPLIHNFIAASVQDPVSRRAVLDKFRLEETPDETIVHYVSPNRLCDFYRGLAQGAAERFGEVLTITETRCMKRGDEECELHVRYAPAQAGGDE